MGTARFGKVLTAMVTPFHDDGSLDLEGAAVRPLAGRPGQRRPRRGRHDRRGPHAVRRREGRAVAGRARRGRRAVARRHRQQRHPPHHRALAAGGRDRGRRVARRVAVLQPAAAGRARGALPGGRRRRRPADRDLRRPHRTGQAIAVDTIVPLATEVPTIAGLKDARGNPGEAAAIVAATPAEFDLYSGDDGLTLPLLAVGAVGVIGVATHWSAGLHAEMIAAHDKNDVEGAREINARLGPSFVVEGVTRGSTPAQPRRR